MHLLYMDFILYQATHHLLV